jgi:hypothetical protein
MIAITTPIWCKRKVGCKTKVGQLPHNTWIVAFQPPKNKVYLYFLFVATFVVLNIFNAITYILLVCIQMASYQIFSFNFVTKATRKDLLYTFLILLCFCPRYPTFLM